ncbi:MAG: iron-sulfur cluster assembly accessory protein [Ardenticatenia bacterium]|nr:iron-sulfur cluster assembly accessory protein [Ardenticatenia bacterium]
MTVQFHQDEALVTMSDAAINVVRALMAQKNIEGYALRVFVTGGGCAGFQYGMAFEREPRPGDHVIEVADDVRVVIDPTSAVYLAGAHIDYVDNLMGGGFRIENPNAVASCGCGHSFRTKEADSASTAGGGCSCG